MIKKVERFIQRHGLKTLLSLPIYPIKLFFYMLYHTTFSFYAILTNLIKYNWMHLSANDQINAYNNLFYYIQDSAVQQAGRYGITNLLNGGTYSLSKLFHLTPVSLRFQASFGTVFMMFFAMLFWLISWVFLYDLSYYTFIILALAFFSTLFFACFIEIQNYNILGWMLYPILFYFLLHGSILNASILLLLISLLSFTALIVSIPFVIVFSFLEPIALLAILPGLVKILIPIIRSKHLNHVLSVVHGEGNVKYSREKFKKLTLVKAYLLIMFSQFTLCYYIFFHHDIFFYMLLLSNLIVLANMTLIRFADEQSLYFIHLTVTTFVMFNISPQPYMAVSYLFSIYIIYTYMPNVRAAQFEAPGIRAPYNIKEDLQGLKKFFSPIPSGEKVIMAYKNPNGLYNEIFSGYRIFNEPIQYAANLHGLSYMPDWYTIMTNNGENDPEDFWVDTPEKAFSFMQKNHFSFIIVPEFIHSFDIDHRFNLMSEYTFTLTESTYTIKLYKLEEITVS